MTASKMFTTTMMKQAVTRLVRQHSTVNKALVRKMLAKEFKTMQTSKNQQEKIVSTVLAMAAERSSWTTKALRAPTATWKPEPTTETALTFVAPPPKVPSFEIMQMRFMPYSINLLSAVRKALDYQPAASTFGRPAASRQQQTEKPVVALPDTNVWASEQLSKMRINW